MKTEQELREAIAQSREQGFRELFEEYSGFVYAIIWYRIRGQGTQEDAEEAVSDVFARIFRTYDQIETGKLQSYIRTVAKHIAIDTLRRICARPDALTDDEHDWQEVASPEDVAQSHELTEMRHYLLDQIKALGEPDTTIVMLRCFYDRRLTEIAKAVKLSPGAVQKRLKRARQKLRQLLTDAGYLP